MSLRKNFQWKFENMILNKIFADSLYLAVLETFLENPTEAMSITNISRRINKNVGSVFRIIPELKKRNLVKELKVSPKRYAYKLNTNEPVVAKLLDFYNSLKSLD
ncbi:MAG: hypothetical protein J7K82_02730 [Thermoproteales archaeon]|nr:hypothetical protein [Thermoproteales archaeon]